MFEISVKKRSKFSKLNPFRKPRIIGLFAYRFDYHLVGDLLQNIQPFVDGWIAWDDRKREDIWYHEGNMRRSLIEKAREYDADWVLCVDPDERYEASFATKIRDLTSTQENIIWGFPFRELYTLNQYRVDGIWGNKIRWNLFPLKNGQEFMNHNVHSEWCPQNSTYERKITDINLYHFKMIDEKNRVERADLYKKIDTNKIQSVGYDYLNDETDMLLQEIPADKYYLPRYKEAPQIIQIDEKYLK